MPQAAGVPRWPVVQPELQVRPGHLAPWEPLAQPVPRVPLAGLGFGLLPVPWVLPEQQARLEHWVLVTLRELQVAEAHWEPEGLPAVVASLHLSVRRVLPEPKV